MKVGHRRRLGLHRGRAAAAALRPPRDRGGRGHRRQPGRGAGGRPHAVAGRRLPGPGLRRVRTRRLDGLDLVFCALPHGESQRLVPGLLGGSGVLVDLAADFRLHDAAALPALVREEHACARLLEPLRLRAARAVPGRPGRGHPGGGPRLLPDRGGLALAPLVGPGWSSPPGSWSTRPAGPRGPGGPPTRPSTSPRSTRTSAPTGCSPTATPPRWSRPWGPGPLHPPPGAHGPGHPGHLLRPAPAGATPTTDGRHGRLARGLRRRALRGGHRRPRLDQGHLRVELRPRSPPGSTPAPAGSLVCAPSTTS